MAQRLVVGIFPDDDPQALQQALKSQPAIDMNNVRVVTASAPSRAHADAPFDFVHVAAAQNDNSLSDTMTRGTGILSDGGGTGVPGIRGTFAADSFLDSSVSDYLSGIGIAEDEVDNFNDAIENGSAVLIYSAGESDGDIAVALKAAGFLQVRTYTPTSA